MKPLVDVGSIVQKIPRGNFNPSGSLSGQIQYRGLFGPRMNVCLDGIAVESGGPNWMDPPLHYLPVALLKSIQTKRGIFSVVTGSGIGGHVQAEYKTSQFLDSNTMQAHQDITLAGTCC
ncbi:TonB-dependent receptor [uncultured Candidatus Thioglobus sp.]|nr:TonB-dependent receptor [uncultured Candidatus Thioglobus sp.]